MRRLLPILVVGGCPTWQRIEPERVCDETAWVVGLRTSDCSGDPELGNEWRDAFRDEVACDPPAEREPADLYECVSAIGASTCEQWDDNQDDWAEWIEISPVCSLYLTVQ